MHPYTVKNYLWAVILLLFIVIALAGCSSAPKVSANKPQYCYTSQTIKTQDGERVSSETTLDCTDDQTKRLMATRMGLSQSCGEFSYWTKIGGRDVERKGISCQRPDGSWEIVNTSGRL